MLILYIYIDKATYVCIILNIYKVTHFLIFIYNLRIEETNVLTILEHYKNIHRLTI